MHKFLNFLGVKLTYSEKTKEKWFLFSLTSRSEENEYQGNKVTIALGNSYKTYHIPWNILKPKKDHPTWNYNKEDVYQKSDEWLKENSTIKYWNYVDTSCEFSIHNNTVWFSLFKLHEPLYNKLNYKTLLDFSWYIPWLNYRRTKELLYMEDGKGYIDATNIKALALIKLQDEIQPVEVIVHDAISGKEVTASLKRTYSEYTLGTSKIWNFILRKKKKSTYIDIHYNDDIGKGYNTYKGGTIGHSIRVDGYSDKSTIDIYKDYCRENYNKDYAITIMHIKN